MAERLVEGDLVVAPQQYALLLDSTKGNVDVLVGPTKTSLSGTDSPVTWDRENRTFIPCNPAGQTLTNLLAGFTVGKLTS